MRRDALAGIGQGDGVEEARPVKYGGQEFSPVGDKDRVTLPAQFRKAVRESSNGRVLCLAIHDRWNCLVGFGTSRDFEQQLDREELVAVQRGKDFDREVRGHQLSGFKEVSFDESGRFILPGFLKNVGKITDSVYFQGAGPFFTLWAPAVGAQLGRGWEGAQAACASLVEEAARARA